MLCKAALHWGLYGPTIYFASGYFAPPGNWLMAFALARLSAPLPPSSRFLAVTFPLEEVVLLASLPPATQPHIAVCHPLTESYIPRDIAGIRSA